MNDITRIIDKYKTISMDDVLSHPDIARDIETLYQKKDSLDKETIDFLEQILQEIEKRSLNLQSMMDETKQKIKSNQQRADANMAYIKNK